MSNLTQFLDQWAKTHPVTEPTTNDNKVEDWLLNGGESPLRMWPAIRSKNVKK